MKKKKSTKSSSNVYFLKKSHCPKQIGLGGTINFPLPKTKNKKTLKNNNNFLNREKVKSTISFVVRGTVV